MSIKEHGEKQDILRLPSELLYAHVFGELRKGADLYGGQKLKPPGGVISTAEAISLITNSMALATSFGNGKISDGGLEAGLQGAVVKDDDKDKIVWKEYLENVMKKEARCGGGYIIRVRKRAKYKSFSFIRKTFF